MQTYTYKKPQYNNGKKPQTMEVYVFNLGGKGLCSLADQSRLHFTEEEIIEAELVFSDKLQKSSGYFRLCAIGGTIKCKPSPDKVNIIIQPSRRDTGYIVLDGIPVCGDICMTEEDGMLVFRIESDVISQSDTATIECKGEISRHEVGYLELFLINGERYYFGNDLFCSAIDNLYFKFREKLSHDLTRVVESGYAVLDVSNAFENPFTPTNDDVVAQICEKGEGEHTIVGIAIDEESFLLPELSCNGYARLVDENRLFITFGQNAKELFEDYEGCEKRKAFRIEADEKYIKDGVLQCGNHSIFETDHGKDTFVIPEGVVEIAEDAFSAFEDASKFFCFMFGAIELPNSLKRIGGGAFRGSTLKCVRIPKNVETIGPEAFSAWELESVSVDEENKFYKSVGNCVIDMRNMELVFGCKNSVIPQNMGIKKIADWAFKNRIFSEITIPETVEEIGNEAFWGCEIQCLTIPESMRIIGDHAFRYSKIKNLFIPKNVEKFSGSSFSKEALEAIEVDKDNPTYVSVGNCLINKKTGELVLGCKNSVIPQDMKIKKIGDFAFNGCHLKNVTLPETLVEIGKNAFENNDFCEITLPDAISNIGKGAFTSCYNLTSVVIPKRVTVINKEVFFGCRELESVTFHDELEEIGKQAFFYCALKTLELPREIIHISDGCFTGCQFQKLELPYIKTIGDNALSFCENLESLVVPNLVKIGGSFLWQCWKLSHIDVGNNADVYISVNNCIIDRKEKALIYARPNSVIPTGIGVKKIAGYAFCCCDDMGDIVIPDEIEEIEDYAFDECRGITSVTWGSGLRKLSEDAFSSCTSTVPLNIKGIDCEVTAEALNGETSRFTFIYDDDWPS